MGRAFVIRVEYNNIDERGQHHGTWVKLMEDFGEDKSLRYEVWYVDYVVRDVDVKSFVKTHIDLLLSFEVPKENIIIEDRRNGKTSSGDPEPPNSGEPGETA